MNKKKLAIIGIVGVAIASIGTVLWLNRPKEQLHTENEQRAELIVPTGENIGIKITNCSQVTVSGKQYYRCALKFFTSSDSIKIGTITYPDNKKTINIENSSVVGIDYDVDVDNLDQTFIVTSADGTITENERTGYIITYHPDNGQPDYTGGPYLKTNKSTAEIQTDIPVKAGSVFRLWSENISEPQGKYLLKSVEERNDKYTELINSFEATYYRDFDLYAKWVAVNNESVLGAVEKITEPGIARIYVEDELYSLDITQVDHTISLDGSQIDGVALNTSSGTNSYSVGNSSDLATSTTYAQNTPVLRVTGDINISSNSVLTSTSNEYGGPKGLFVYCSGTLTNNGEISMTGKGSKAVSQNVYLWKKDGSYDGYTVPKVGASGADSSTTTDISYVHGIKGNSAAEGSRQLGGGGSGGVLKHCCNSTGHRATSGGGASATSYSGGAGGGGVTIYGTGGTADGADDVGDESGDIAQGPTGGNGTSNGTNLIGRWRYWKSIRL